MTPTDIKAAEERVKEQALVERLSVHLPLLDSAAIPTKCEVFTLCGGPARDLHDAITEALALLSRLSELQAENKAKDAALSVARRALERIADADRQRLECGRSGGPHQEADFSLTSETRNVADQALAALQEARLLADANSHYSGPQLEEIALLSEQQVEREPVAASDRAFVRHLIREMRASIAANPEAPTVTTGPLDPDILERVLNIALSPPPPEQQVESGRLRGIYVASRASVPERSAMWRDYRAKGVPIISTWIDEAGEGETDDQGELWGRILREVTNAERLILYVEPTDFPLKGAYVEVGMALAAGTPVTVVAPGVDLCPRTARPLGSWSLHPLVSFADTVDEALSPAQAEGEG